MKNLGRPSKIISKRKQNLLVIQIIEKNKMNVKILKKSTKKIKNYKQQLQRNKIIYITI